MGKPRRDREQRIETVKYGMGVLEMEGEAKKTKTKPKNRMSRTRTKEGEPRSLDYPRPPFD